ncbi:AbfB domain-containing protein [Paenibacillus alvei]|uniref:AbfB domain-containing protein n=1 Tax=Paenibacillus alvei TaxID=44250 RepID=UPI001F50AD2C|nr:AbfB domain-containing protein [Paenibacillus alvei]MCY9579726.1 AbfB domain-containing protein [Paenibacillus alvei]MCY9586379.1 AbfB domain-containing protein [Paenibacillus alvei]
MKLGLFPNGTTEDQEYNKNEYGQIHQKRSGSMTYMSLRSYNYPERFIRHRNYLGEISPIISDLDKKDATFNLVWIDEVRQIARLESYNYPNHFLRHQNYRIMISPDNQNDPVMQGDSMWFVDGGLAGSEGISFQSRNYPKFYIRHRNNQLWLDRINLNSELDRKDSTFLVTRPWSDLLENRQTYWTYY